MYALMGNGKDAERLITSRLFLFNAGKLTASAAGKRQGCSVTITVTFLIWLGSFAKC